jgi:hypothetical protein
MAKNPNQGGSSNRQGPKTTSGAKAINGSHSKFGAPTTPWSLGKNGAKASGAGRNMAGSNWKKRPPNG